MGLFRAVLKGSAVAAKQMDENRTEKINFFEQSGIIQFAGGDEFAEYYNLPITYFGNPVDLKKKEIMYEMVAKLLKPTEYQQLASQGLTYCITADAITGKASNGMIFHEKGVFDGGFFTEFIPRERIVEIGTDKKGWIYINDSDSVQHYLVGANSKKVKAEFQRFVQLLKRLYVI